jgi:hypothetical protein
VFFIANISIKIVLQPKLPLPYHASAIMHQQHRKSVATAQHRTATVTFLTEICNGTIVAPNYSAKKIFNLKIVRSSI